MGGRLIHIHEPRLGAGIPARTVRPYPRAGDAVLGAFREALGHPGDGLLVTGRLFHRPEPPAHLVDRVVGSLGALAAAGRDVRVPADTPRALLFLAAGIRLVAAPATGGAPAFHRTGAFRVLAPCGVRTEHVALPRSRRVRADVTGLTAAEALRRIGRAVRRDPGARLVRLTLAGESDEPELLAFGPRELLHHLPGGVEGLLENRVRSRRRPAPTPEDPEARRAALLRVRERLPAAPAATGVYEFLDRDGRVLYVGKAVDLRRRVASHFTAELREPSPREPMLLSARDLRFREAGSEVEALLLEADRIREARPPYNRRMREPEAARYLRAAPDDPMPSLSSAARVEDDGAAWYGPFARRWVLERALRVLGVAWGLGACGWRPGEPPPRACSDRELSVCAAPCAGRVSLGAYRERVRAALDDLLGRGGPSPAFGALNPLSAGLLGREDLRVYESFRRSLGWFTGTLARASGGIPLAGGRVLLVLSGHRAGERRFPDPASAQAWVARRVAEHRRLPAPTCVAPDRIEEVRILARALRSAGEPWYLESP